MSNYVLDINNICTNVKYTISKSSYFLEDFPTRFGRNVNSNYIRTDNSLVLAQYSTQDIVNIKNDTKVTTSDNTYLMYYQFPNKLTQLSYLVNDSNGLHYNGKYISLGIDDYSIKEILNKLFYNVNSIPYSTKTFNGILYLNNSYIANESIQANNTLIDNLLMQENTLNFYNKQLNIIKDHVLFYRYIKNILLSYPNQITFTKKAFKQNIINGNVEILNSNVQAQINKIHKDTQYWDIDNNELVEYTQFRVVSTNTYNIDSDISTYLSLNNTYIKYCDNYYFINNLIPREYKSYFFTGLENNGDIYCKSVQDLEFNIYTNYFDNETIEKEDNNVFNEYNIYMSVKPNLLNDISLIPSCNYIVKKEYNSDTNMSYANYSNNTIYYTNSTDNLKFRYSNTYVSLFITPSCSYFNYKINGENNVDTKVYPLGTNHIIASYNKNILAYVDCNIYDNIKIHYDPRQSVTNTQIIDAHNYQNSYVILFEYDTSLKFNNSINISKYIFNVLLKHNCIFYNSEPYIFYGYYEITTSDAIVHKKYRDIANKNIPLQFAKLNPNNVKLNYIINDRLLLRKFDDLEFKHVKGVTTNKKIYMGKINTNNSQYIIVNPIPINL